MNSTRILLAMQLKGWLRSGRQAVGLLLGLALAFYNLSRYVSFAAAVGAPVNPLEGLIVIGSTPHYLTGLFLGAVILLSDTPFLSKRSRYEVLRMGKKTWIRAELAYITASVFLYMLLIAAASILMLVFTVPFSFRAGYSPCMEMLAFSTSDFAVRLFHFSFPYPALVEGLPAVAAFLVTYFLNSAYFILIFCVVFIVGITCKNAAGWAAGASIQIVCYVLGFLPLGVFAFLCPMFLAMPGPAAALGGIRAVAAAAGILPALTALFLRLASRREKLLEI